MEVPVYLFTGFLGSGKSTFIQDLLEGSEFNAGDKTLLLVCEKGKIKYDKERFARPNVFIEIISKEDDLTMDLLEELQAKYMMERVVVEYNGMWMLEKLFRAMPPEWIIYQELMFADAGNFMMYNQNMRQQTFDKMKTAELVVFNRFTALHNKVEFHKVVRVANRKSQILYEYGPDHVEPDDIEDPLPYDIAKPSIEIKEDQYAEWYRDIYENADRYEGKMITVKGRVAMARDLPQGKFAFGRHVMTCCIEDIQFAGLVCDFPGEEAFSTGDWVEIKAKVKIEDNEIYGQTGPVMYCISVEPTKPAEPEVATF